MNLQELIEEKGRLANEAGEILRKAEEEKRQVRKDEEDKFDKIHGDIETISRQIERLHKQNAVIASLDESNGRRSQQTLTTNRGTQTTSATHQSGRPSEMERAEATRAWMLGGVPDRPVTDQQRELARRCNLPIEAKRTTLFLPSVPLKSMHPDAVRDWKTANDERRAFDESRAALTGTQSTTTTGGYTTADATMRALEFALLAYGGIRTVATVLRTDTGGPLPIPTSDDSANKGEIIAENTTYNELEMTFGQLVLDAYKYSSKYIKASVEFLQDTSLNAADFLGNALGIRIARITSDHFTTGTGSSQPNGVMTAATSSGVTFAGATTISYDNMVDLLHSVDPAYRDPNGRWMFHDSGLKMIKKVKVAQFSGDTGGWPLWTPGLANGEPNTILGYPYTINQSVATVATGVRSIAFGDFSKYQIRDVREVTLLRLDERFAELGQVAFLAFSRHDGDLLDAGTRPVKYGVQA